MMFQTEIDKKYHNMFQTNKRLNIELIYAGEKGSSGYYHKMQDWYLHDMELMTGTSKGFIKEDGFMIFLVDGIGIVDTLAISFNYYHSATRSGGYSGIKYIWFRRRENGSPKITQSERKKMQKSDLLLTFQKFITTAEQLGYLID